jgi:hypothetical protein
MKPRITVITIGVDDLEESLRFYRDGLALSTEGIVGREFEHGAVVFIDLQAGLRLALWPRKSIAHDSGLAPGKKSPTEFTLGHNVSSKEEVDTVMKRQRTRARSSLSPPRIHFGVAMLAIFRILTVIFGRLYGIRSGAPKIEA